MTHLPPLILAVSMALAPLACAPSAEEEVDARQILEESAQALRAVETVRYEFQFGGPDDPFGWISGTVMARQREEAVGSWLRIEGTVHAQPGSDDKDMTFAFGSDGETAWARDGDGPLRSAPVGAGSNLLSANAAYGWLPEFVEAQPLWRELGRAETMSRLEPETVNGVLCDVVQVQIATESGPAAEVRWAIAREDRLPRRGQWFTPLSGPDGMMLTLGDLRTGVSLAVSDFSAPPAGAASEARTAAIGEPAPEWALETPSGEVVRPGDLVGQVVVLDFWNTWCPVCRSIGPDTRALAREYADDPVRFFGVNLFETSDPVAYWQEIGEPYEMLLEGEELARALDLPWQPGIAVIGPRGNLLYTQLGASADRVDKVRSAIVEGLSRIGSAEAQPPA